MSLSGITTGFNKFCELQLVEITLLFSFATPPRSVPNFRLPNCNALSTSLI